MKADKSSVKGQLDIFAAMNRAAEAVDKMVEDEKTKKVDMKSSKQYESEKGKQLDVINAVDMHASLQKTFINRNNDDFAMVAYIDYNMVYLKNWNVAASLRCFDTSKEAVNYYMDQLERLCKCDLAELVEENEPFLDMKYVVDGIYTEFD